MFLLGDRLIDKFVLNLKLSALIPLSVLMIDASHVGVYVVHVHPPYCQVLTTGENNNVL